MAYTVKIAPDTVGFNENGNKLKLRDSSFKNVFEKARTMVVRTPETVVNNQNVNVSKEASSTLSASLPPVSKTIKNGEGLVGSVVAISGKRPVKIKPFVVEAVKRVGQSALVKVNVQEEIPELTQEIPIEEVQKQLQDDKVNQMVSSTLESASTVSENTAILDAPVVDDSRKNEQVKLENIDNIGNTSSLQTEVPVSNSDSKYSESVEKKDVITSVDSQDSKDLASQVALKPKTESKIVNLDDVRQMQEKLDEVGKATIEAKQKVVETKNQINDVRKLTESEKADLEKLSKDQKAAEQRSEMLKQKTCEFLEQQMLVLEKKKTAYFEQLSDYEVTLEQVKEEKKQIEIEKTRKEQEVQKAQEDYEAWSLLHSAITNKAAEFDSQLGQDDSSKIVSVRDLALERANSVIEKPINDVAIDNNVSVKRLA